MDAKKFIPFLFVGGLAVCTLAYLKHKSHTKNKDEDEENKLSKK